MDGLCCFVSIGVEGVSTGHLTFRFKRALGFLDFLVFVLHG